MARNRQIKAEFWCDKKTNSLPPVAQLLFIGTWNFADDSGVCRADITYLQSNIFPYTSVTKNQIKEARDLLVERNLVLYSIFNDEEYILIKNFKKHQKIDRVSKFRYIESDYKTIFELKPNTRRAFDEHSTLNVKENVNVNVKENEKANEKKLFNVGVVDDATAATEFKKDLNNWYGEFSNVHLSKAQYGKLLSMTANKDLLKTLIDELSENIASKKDKAKPYDDNYPAMHFLAVKKYWEYRKTHPEKFKKDTAAHQNEHEKYLLEKIKQKESELKND